MTVYILYAHFADSHRAALKAFATHEAAKEHVTRVTAQPWDDEQRLPLASAAETLGITGFSIEALPVEGA